MSKLRFHPLKVNDIRRETADCLSVSFAVPPDLKEDFQFQQGQYLTLRTDINGEDIRRTYSICSGVCDGELRVAIKKLKNGVFSQWVFEKLSQGDELQVMVPMGNFTSTLDPKQKKNYLFVAAGSGITPIMSIIKSVLSVEPQSEISLIYGNRFFSSIIFRDELEDLKDKYLGRFRIFHVMSSEQSEIDLFHGRIDQQKMDEFCHSFIRMDETDEVFICGPEPMIRTVKDFALARGKKETHIHFELFIPPGVEDTPPVPVADIKSTTPPTHTLCDVTVILDGRHINFKIPMDGTRILDAALAQGIDAPYSCRAGMCCTCKAHLDEGKVEMAVNYALEPGEVDAGFILTCQSRPLTDHVVVNYDKQ